MRTFDQVQVISIVSSARYIVIDHGKQTVKVPFSIFKGTRGDTDTAEELKFRKTLRERYPWLTENSLDVLLRKAKREYVRIVDDESNGRTVAKELADKGMYEDAVAHLKRHLEKDPEDADSWYALGDILCKMGKADEGYKAYARGRDLF